MLLRSAYSRFFALVLAFYNLSARTQMLFFSISHLEEGEEHDVLAGGQAVKQHVVLRADAQYFAGPTEVVLHAVAVNGRRAAAAVGRKQAGQHVDGGGFAL